MNPLLHLNLSALIALSFFSLISYALELEPILPRGYYGRGPGRLVRRDFSALDLKNVETFLWGAEDDGDALLGNFTIEMPDDQEGILSMERFHGMISSTKCNDNGLVLKFDDDSSFKYAQKVWDWVNGADNHTFLMVTGKGDCGHGAPRKPYLVSSITYDEKSITAHLTASTGPWQDLAHTYELRVGQVPMSKDLGLRRRDYTKDASMNLASDFRTKIRLGTDKAWGELTCNPCDLRGQIKFEFVIKSKFKIPVGFRMRMAPQDVVARATIGFEIGAAFDTHKELVEKASIYKIPLSGVSIPGGILTIGPVLDIQGGVEVTGFELDAKFSSAMTATLPNSAVVQADFLSLENNEFSSWIPKFTVGRPTVQVTASSTVELYIDPGLKVEAEALGQGFETGLDLKMPVIEGKIDAIASQGGGACEDGDNHEFAVKVGRYIGFEIDFVAGKINGDEFKRTIGSDSYEWGDPLCIPIGKPISAPSKSGAPTPPVGLPAPSQSATANSCSVLGKSGTCISTANCKANGGTSTSGFCPKDPDDVKCCTDGQPSSTINTCQIGLTKGECITKTACSNKGKAYKSTAGYCLNDPTSILCCTGVEIQGPVAPSSAPKPPSKPAAHTCKIGNTSGNCLSKSDCSAKGDGYKSTAGYCLNDPDEILCCTKPTMEEKPAPKPTGNTCKIGVTNGDCISKSDCSAKGTGYKSTAGYCPNDPNEILCCTGPEKAGPPSGPSSAHQCTIKPAGTKGECLPTGTCGDKGYTSTPGFCPDDPTDVQCCTPPPPQNKGGPIPE